MIGAGLSIPQLAVRRPGAADQAITATAAPQLGPLAGGDTLSGAVTWGSYETSQGSLVTPTAKEMRVNGAAFVAYDGARVVSAGDAYTLRETVENTEGDSRAFSTSTVTVSGIAPTATGGVADQTFTLNEAITPLDVAADFTGSAPITYALAPASDALPAGLSLSSAGEISGTPTEEVGPVNIEVRGTNADGSDDTAFAVTVAAVLPFQQILDAAAAAGAVAVYNPDDPNTTTIRTDAGKEFCVEVADGRGNKNPLVMATASRQPELVLTSTGRRVWTNDASDKFMLADFTTQIDQPNTTVIVSVITNDAFVVDAFAASTSDRQIIRLNETKAEIWAGIDWPPDGTLASPETFQTFQANFDGASSELYEDNLLITSGNPGSNGLGGVGILQRGGDSLILPANGELAFVILFDTLKTNADLADLRTVINAHYPIGSSA